MRFFIALILTLLSISSLEINNEASLSHTNQLPRMAPVHFLIPFTTQDQLIPCSEYFDEKLAVQESLSCSNNEIFSKAPYGNPLQNVPVPNCYVISKNSPDLYIGEGFNYITSDIFQQERILGFYETETKTVYLAETYDVRKVALHEYQHYFLDLMENDGNGRHDHNIWKKCEPPYYDPSKESLQNYKKTGNNFPKKSSA